MNAVTRARRLLIGALALALTALQACSAKQAASPEPEVAEWLEHVRSAHAAADAAQARGDGAQALVRLQKGLDEHVPDAVDAQDARAVRQDLWFRIAELQLANGDAGAALQSSDHGLELGRGPDLFTANLWIARGEAMEAAGHDSEAAASYYEALLINRVLMRYALRAQD